MPNPRLNTKGGRELEVEPVRVVVELRHDEFAALDRAMIGHRVTPATYIKLVALRLVAEVERENVLNSGVLRLGAL